MQGPPRAGLEHRVLCRRLRRRRAEKATTNVITSVSQMLLWLGAATLGADFFGGVLVSAALEGAEAMSELAFTLPYGRAMESEADALGAEIAARACLDPRGGVRVMRMFESFEEGAARGGGAATVARGALPLSGGGGKGKGGGGGGGGDDFERYLRTHPYPSERAAALDERMLRSLETLRESECGRYALELYRGLGVRSLITNASSANHGKVFLPTDAWRRRFPRGEDARTLKRDGIVRTVENKKRQGGLDVDGTATGPIGRHDTERLKRLLLNPQKVGARGSAGARTRRTTTTCRGPWAGRGKDRCVDRLSCRSQRRTRRRKRGRGRERFEGRALRSRMRRRTATECFSTICARAAAGSLGPPTAAPEAR